MAGINETAPGFKKAVIRPQVDWRIGSANCYLDTASGRYESLWKITKDGAILIEISTPFDTETKIILNDAKIADIIINDKKLSETNYICREEENNVVIEVEAGTYFIGYMPTKDYKMTYSLQMTVGVLFANKKAKEILEKELNEQILDDGAHFELSPMYHQLMLFRVLDCINLVQNNSWKNKELLNFLEEKASVMLGWLKSISYENGEIPLLNDSANCIAPISNELFKYANNLKLRIKK